MLLNDATISREPLKVIDSLRCNAEWALKTQSDQLVAQFEDIEEQYLRERKRDVQVVERIFKNLAGQSSVLPMPDPLNDDAILIAHDLSPADMVYFAIPATSPLSPTLAAPPATPPSWRAAWICPRSSPPTTPAS